MSVSDYRRKRLEPYGEAVSHELFRPDHTANTALRALAQRDAMHDCAAWLTAGNSVAVSIIEKIKHLPEDWRKCETRTVPWDESNIENTRGCIRYKGIEISPVVAHLTGRKNMVDFFLTSKNCRANEYKYAYTNDGQRDKTEPGRASLPFS